MRFDKIIAKVKWCNFSLWCSYVIAVDYCAVCCSRLFVWHYDVVYIF